MTVPIDSIMFVSFGGPEGPEDVIPFLENVLRGKPVPRERLLEVADHYQQFGGVSPINAQNRTIIAKLSQALQKASIDLPIIWGNRNWKPYIVDGLAEMKQRGLKRALPVFTNMFSSYSGCRQYRENLSAALQQLDLPASLLAPRLRFGFNHPKFIEAQTALIREAFDQLPNASDLRVRLLFSAHSIPLSMSDHCDYVLQLQEAGRLIAEQLSVDNWELVYQSRSGPPQQPWLEPDICDRLEALPSLGTQAAVVAPLGFISDHIEVLYDLDTEARQTCQQLGVQYCRANAVGTHPAFVEMLVELIEERLDESKERKAIGKLAPVADLCSETCCLYPRPKAAPNS